MALEQDPQLREPYIDEYAEIDLREMLGTLWDGKWIVASITAAAVAVAGIFSYFIISPTYEAQSTVVVSEIASTDLAGDTELQSLLQSVTTAPGRSLQTYEELIVSSPVLDAVVEKSGSALTVDGLRAKIDLAVLENTNLIRITVSDSDPEQAARLADLVVTEAEQYITQLDRKRLEQSTVFVDEQIQEQQNDLQAATDELETFLKQSPSVEELRQEIDAKTSLLTNYKEQLITLGVQAESLQTSAEATEQALADQDRVLVKRQSISEEPLLHNVVKDDTGGSTRDTAPVEMHSEVINPTYTELQTSLANKTIELARVNRQRAETQDRVNELSAELETLRSQFAGKNIQQQALQKNVERAQNAYQELLNTQEEIRVAQAAKISLNTMTVASRPAVPTSPVAPRKTLNMAIALVLGGMVGVFTVFTRNWLRD